MVPVICLVYQHENLDHTPDLWGSPVNLFYFFPSSLCLLVRFFFLCLRPRSQQSSPCGHCSRLHAQYGPGLASRHPRPSSGHQLRLLTHNHCSCLSMRPSPMPLHVAGARLARWHSPSVEIARRRGGALASSPMAVLA